LLLNLVDVRIQVIHLIVDISFDEFINRDNLVNREDRTLMGVLGQALLAEVIQCPLDHDHLDKAARVESRFALDWIIDNILKIEHLEDL